MSVMIGVISYLPDDSKRTKRLQASRTQIEWLHKLFNHEKIIVIAQNYNKDDYLDDPLVEYIKYDKGIGAGNARNVILKNFYNSDKDWLFICDDDTTAYPYYNYEEFFKDLSNIHKFDGIDAISAIEPEYTAYKKNNFEDKANLTHYKFTPRELNCGSATSFMRNIRKYYGKEVYYNNILADKSEGLEDVEFLLDWVLQGFTWYKMNTWIRKSLAFNQSTIWEDDKDARNSTLSKCLDKVCERFKFYGINRKINGNVNWADFNSVYNNTLPVLYIERENPISYDENTTPKNKNKNILLF